MTTETTTTTETPAAKPEAKPANFIMFVGDSFYTKTDFLDEAALLGVSKRLPSYKLPADLQVGKSKVYLMAGGKRPMKLADGSEAPTADIFGYFIPDAIEFIAGEDGEDAVYADITAYVKTKTEAGWRVVTSTTAEAPRKCGRRKVGGTYLVAKGGATATSPITMLGKDAPFRGNHFRGMMRLDEAQTQAIETGVGLDRLTKVACEDCGEDVFVSPDSIKRKEREDRRVSKGDARQWFIRCPACAKAARDAKKAAEPTTESSPEATMAEGVAEASAE